MFFFLQDLPPAVPVECIINKTPYYFSINTFFHSSFFHLQFYKSFCCFHLYNNASSDIHFT